MKIISLPANMSMSSIVFSYIAVYGRTPPEGFLPIQTDSDEDEWNNIKKDIHLKNEWIEQLNTIPEIEILSTCEGHARYIVTHIIFLLKDQERIEEVYKKLKQLPTSIYATKIIPIQTSVGVCFCIAIYNWYREHMTDNSDWEKWWDNIIDHIKNSVGG